MADIIPNPFPDSVKERFWSRVDKRGPDECWEWKGFVTKQGYGRFNAPWFGYQAHRLSLLMTGAVPKEGDVTDHICRNKSCVNPSHLRFVTQKINATENSIGIAAVNVAKTHCKRGHPLFGENLKINAFGGRVCRDCERMRCREYMRGLAAKARAAREQTQRADSQYS